MLSKQKECILKLIPKARSDNNPAAPEFPPDHPKFPATPTTKADKLYAPHLPFTNIDKQRLRFYRELGYVGQESGVFLVQERFIIKAHAWMTKQGINCEPSGSAGLAYLMQHEQRFPKNKKIVVVNTGRGSVLE